MANVPNNTIAVVECDLDAETKNTVRYAEVGGGTKIRTVYLSKEILAQPYPARIEVTVRVGKK